MVVGLKVIQLGALLVAVAQVVEDNHTTVGLNQADQELPVMALQVAQVMARAQAEVVEPEQ
jgi:hypothetical protein